MTTDKHKNIYLAANQLADLLRQCPEYSQYIDARERLQNDPLNKAVLQDLRRKQYDLQASGPDAEDFDQKSRYVEDMLMSVALNPTVNEYLNAEYNFGRIVERLGEIFDCVFPYDDLFDEENAEVQAAAPAEPSALSEPTYLN